MTLDALALASLMTIAAAGSLRAQTPSPAAPQPRGRSGRARHGDSASTRRASGLGDAAGGPLLPHRNVPGARTADQRQGRSHADRSAGRLRAGQANGHRARGRRLHRLHPDAVTGDPGRCGAAQRRCVTNAARRRKNPPGHQLAVRLARPHRDQLGAGDGRQHVASRSADDDSRERQADDRGAIGGPDRRAAGDCGGEGDSTAIEKLASW